MELLNSAEFWTILALIIGFLGMVWTVVALLIKQPPETTIAVKQGIDAMQDFAENRAKELKESKVNEIIILKENENVIEIKKRGRPKKVVNDIDNNYTGA